MNTKLELLQAWHDLAIKTEGITLYYFDPQDKEWISVDEADEITEAGLVTSYDEEIEVVYGERAKTEKVGSDKREYCRTTHFTAIEEIQYFKVCQIQPRNAKDKATELENLVNLTE